MWHLWIIVWAEPWLTFKHDKQSTIIQYSIMPHALVHYCQWLSPESLGVTELLGVQKMAKSWTGAKTNAPANTVPEFFLLKRQGMQMLKLEMGVESNLFKNLHSLPISMLMLSMWCNGPECIFIFEHCRCLLLDVKFIRMTIVIDQSFNQSGAQRPNHPI